MPRWDLEHRVHLYREIDMTCIACGMTKAEADLQNSCVCDLPQETCGHMVALGEHCEWCANDPMNGGPDIYSCEDMD